MNRNVSGNNNTAVGENALYYNQSGSYNVSIGSQSLKNNTSGNSNIAIGYEGLFNNTYGYENIAIGEIALENNTSGDENVMIGDYAGNQNDDGDAETKTSTSRTHSIAIGANSRITANNQVRIGNSSISSIGGYKAWTELSDARFKENVNNDVPGLEFITELKPVSYNLNVEKLNNFLNVPDSLVEDKSSKEAIAAKESIIYSGFIAQEVEEAAESIGYDFSGVDKPGNENDHYGLRYSKFVVPLVKAVQEQQEIIESQKAENEVMKNRVNELEQKYEELKQMIENK